MFSFIKSIIKKLKALTSAPANQKNTYLNSYSYEKGDKKAKFLMDKGEYLERSIFDVANKIVGYGFKKILVDLHFKKPKGGSNQVDLVILHKTGVYVIEAKNLSGSLYGDNDGRYWTQKLGKNTFKPYNPILQNNAHIRNVKKALGVNDSDIVSIIVFGNKATINYKGNLNLIDFDTKLVNLCNFRKCIKSYFSSRNDIFSEDDIFRMYDILSKYARADFSTKSEHIKYVKDIQNNNKTI